MRLPQLFVCLSLGLLFLAACSEQPAKASYPDELSRLSAVAVTSTGFSLEPGSSLGWRTEVIWLQGDNSHELPPGVNSQGLRTELERQLQAMGHSFVAADESADYVLIAAVILGESEAGDEFIELAKLYPSLEYVSQTLEKGSLLVGLSRPGSPVILWRAGIQAFIAENLTPAQRQQRLEAIVRSLLRTLPIAR